MQNIKYLPGLDVLRVFALTAVLLFHLMPGVFRGGYLGVEMFFVLCGFLLTYILQNLRNINVPVFYLTKIRQLIPPMLIMILVTCGALKLLVPESAWGLKGSSLSMLLNYYNWRQISMSSDYFASIGAGSPFTHMWTISVQMQFFLIWPFIWLWAKKRNRLGQFRAVKRLTIAAAIPAVVMFAVSFMPNTSAFLYYSTVTRMGSLLLGAAAGIYYKQGSEITYRLYGFLSRHLVLSLLFWGANIAAAVFLLMFADGSNMVIYRGGMALTAVWCAFLVLVAAEYEGNSDSRFISFCHRISRSGYEIYLWQYPVIFILNSLLGQTVPVKLLEAAVTFVLAFWAVYFLGRIRQMMNSFISSRRTRKRRRQAVRNTKQELFDKREYRDNEKDKMADQYTDDRYMLHHGHRNTGDRRFS